MALYLLAMAGVPGVLSASLHQLGKRGELEALALDLPSIPSYMLNHSPRLATCAAFSKRIV